MSLKLMFITNDPQVAEIAEDAGVDRIFIDMEYIDKDLRQGDMNTVQNHHTIQDIISVRSHVKKELLVRCNPIHEETGEYYGSQKEIDYICEAGADIVMLPYFKTVEEVKKFIAYVNKRAKVMLLVETVEAVDHIDEILEVDGIDEVLIGLNDLSLGYKMKFMFEPLANGTVEALCNKFKYKNIPYGFGGIASLNKGLLPSEYIIGEHYRLGSECVILSRSFCNCKEFQEEEDLKRVFRTGVKGIREYEKYCSNSNEEFFLQNQKELINIVNKIVGK